MVGDGVLGPLEEVLFVKEVACELPFNMDEEPREPTRGDEVPEE
jgi:hypothetical protein